MITLTEVNYNGKILTYDKECSKDMIVPIYRSNDGQLYMPLNERFITLKEVIAALENSQRRKLDAI